MLIADSAHVTWDTEKKHWIARVQVGEEVMRRALSDVPHEAADDVLRSAAVATAADDGYELASTKVDIAR